MCLKAWISIIEPSPKKTVIHRFLTETKQNSCTNSKVWIYKEIVRFVSVSLLNIGRKWGKRANLKTVFQENKAVQIFRKTNIFYPLIHKRTCAYQGVRNVCFWENLASFVFLKHPFWDSPFCLFTNVLTLFYFFAILCFTSI